MCVVGGGSLCVRKGSRNRGPLSCSPGAYFERTYGRNLGEG